MIEATGLTKRLGGRSVVSDVSFRCEPGTVTGFLGPNGAGKTTTLRMLVGLSDPEAGRSAVLDRPYRALENPGRRVGVLLDASAQHPGRRGREALAVSAQMMGVPRQRVDELLRIVGLDEPAARKRVRQYSLGMRQRLGLAHALLGDPEVLVLDEPANGLDPEGIRWMRLLLRDFADRGGTVLLSSHLLGEVQATVDRLVVISAGRVVARGALEALLTSSGLVVRATDTAALSRALDNAHIDHCLHEDGSVMVEKHDGIDAERLARLAAAAGVLLVELRDSDRTGLEQLFSSLTGGAHTPPNAAPQTLEVVR